MKIRPVGAQLCHWKLTDASSQLCKRASERFIIVFLYRLMFSVHTDGQKHTTGVVVILYTCHLFSL